MSMIIDGTNGLTFNNATTQASAGVVLQVVNAIYSTTVTNSTSTYADTGLTATITPKFTTSKILILVNQNGLYKGTGNASNSINLKLLKNSSNILTFAGIYGYTGVNNEIVVGSASCSYLDSPATISAVIYKTQYANYSNTASVSLQNFGENSTITLMEIAA